MSGRRQPRKRSWKKLAYGVVAVAFILACFLIFFSLHSSPPKVAIVDQLSYFPEQRNQAFVNDCIDILEEGGLTWVYHEGNACTVDFYRNLPSYGTSLIILRVHSAIMKTPEGTISILGLFTSEPFSIEAAQKYPEDIRDNRLVEAFFSPEERRNESYFGIVPEFVEKSMKGKFKDTIVVMMGCEGLGYEAQTYTDMAEAFVKKGAKVYVGWDAPVSINRTDQATVQLLKSLISYRRGIEDAVLETMEEIGPDHTYNSTLQYYPDTTEVRGYTIPNLESKLAHASLNVAYTSPTPTMPIRLKCMCTKHICRTR